MNFTNPAEIDLGIQSLQFLITAAEPGNLRSISYRITEQTLSGFDPTADFVEVCCNYRLEISEDEFE